MRNKVKYEVFPKETIMSWIRLRLSKLDLVDTMMFIMFVTIVIMIIMFVTMLDKQSALETEFQLKGQDQT